MIITDEIKAHMLFRGSVAECAHIAGDTLLAAEYLTKRMRDLAALPKAELHPCEVEYLELLIAADAIE